MKNKIIATLITLCIVVMVVYSIVSSQTIEASGTDEKPVSNEQPEVIEEEVEETAVIAEMIYVEIKGAVVNPGVYQVEDTMRIFELISLAGGLIEDANIEYINQSRVLKDQMLIVILTNAEIAKAIENQELREHSKSEVYEFTGDEGDIKGSDGCYCEESTSSGSGGLISINNASMEELMTLDGIGESKASDIIEYREKNGGFKTLEELLNVSGIGEATYNKIKDNITL